MHLYHLTAACYCHIVLLTYMYNPCLHWNSFLCVSSKIQNEYQIFICLRNIQKYDLLFVSMFVFSNDIHFYTAENMENTLPYIMANDSTSEDR